MSKISWWSKFCALPRFSFLLAEGPSVRKVHDTCGNWVDQSAVSQIVDDMQAEINVLRERLERLKPEGARPFIPQEAEPVDWTDKLTDSLHDLFLLTPGGRSPSWARINDVVLENVPTAISPPKPAAQPQVPEGYQLVPVEMEAALVGKIVDAVFDGALEDWTVITDIWDAALSAAKDEGK